MEQIIESPIEIIKKVRKTHIRKYEEGAKEHEKTSKYHQKYYHEKNYVMNCPICDRKTSFLEHKRHQKSKYCLKIKAEKTDFIITL